jgi:hypothetical protein
MKKKYCASKATNKEGKLKVRHLPDKPSTL